VTHVNATARVQTVDKSWNERFHRLLERFHARSGVAVLLNTSFNKKGMPIAELPQEAVELFLESALDVLVIGDYMVEKGA
jgi:carbamoyltransferase